MRGDSAFLACLFRSLWLTRRVRDRLTDEVECRTHLTRLVHASLGEAAYELVRSEAAGTQRLLLFARAAGPAACESLSSLRCWKVDTGGAGVFNKGGIGLSFALSPAPPPPPPGAPADAPHRPPPLRIALVGTHGPAHGGAERVAARSASLAAVLSGGDDTPVSATSLPFAPGGLLRGGGGGSPAGLETSHDHVFVFGDLNYRIDGEWGAVGDAIRRRDWGSLAGSDELGAERSAGRALVDYTEGPLSFPPTYKLVRPSEGGGGGKRRAARGGGEGAGGGTGGGGGVTSAVSAVNAVNAVNAPVYAASRVPSWTDRVLFRTGAGARPPARLTAYGPSFAVATSDHAPVSATFLLPLG